MATAFEAAAAAGTEAGDAELLARAEAGAVRAISIWEDDPPRRARLEAAAAGLPPGDHPAKVELYGRLAVMCLAREGGATRPAGGVTRPWRWPGDWAIPHCWPRRSSTATWPR